MMTLSITTIVLSILTLLALVGSGLSLTLLMVPKIDARRRKCLQVILPVIVFGSLGLFVYRLVWVHHTWQPLESHVDGLILINSLVAMTLCFLQTRKRMHSISAFVLPVLAFLLAWAICASAWTYQLFPIGDIWTTVHRLGVYLGSVFYLIAAASGVMFLYVRSQLKFKRSPAMLDRLPSLEAIEQLIIHTATLGFALITLGLVSGVIIIASGPTMLGHGWWYSPKVVFATLAWLVYAVVMNVRYTKTFRGQRAAWLSIVGFILVLATFVAALVMAEKHSDEQPRERTQVTKVEIEHRQMLSTSPATHDSSEGQL